MILLIKLDKGDQFRNYTAFEDALKSQSVSWWHHMADTWIIRTPHTPTQVYNAVQALLWRDDRLLIIEVKRNYQGWLNQQAWDWIKQEFKNDSLLGI